MDTFSRSQQKTEGLLAADDAAFFQRIQPSVYDIASLGATLPGEAYLPLGYPVAISETLYR